MKLTNKLFFVATAALVAFACTKEIDSPQTGEQNPALSDGESVEMTFGAVTETGAIGKTYIDVTDGYKPYWEASDKIAVYDGTEAPKTFTVKSSEGATAVFEGMANSQAETFYAVYPASAAAATMADGNIQATVPSVQKLSGKNTASGSLLAVAKEAGNKFSFKNVCGLIKIDITVDGISEVVIAGKGNEVIAGTVAIDPLTGEVKSVVKGAKDITLRPAGETFAQGTYYVATLPVEFTKGYAVVIRRAEDGLGAVKETSQTIAPIARSGGKYFGNITDDRYSCTWTNVIANQTDMKAFHNDLKSNTSTKTWVLAADIDMTGLPWETPVNNGDATTFKGTFDGRGHCIYNIKNGAHGGRNYNSGFFNMLENATVKNFILGSKDGEAWDGYSEVTNYTTIQGGFEYVGAIAGRLKGTASVQNVTNFSPITIKAENKSWVRVGGITGIMSGTSSLSGCVNKGNIYSKGTSTRAISVVNGADLSVIGGLVGFYESTHANAIKDSYNYGSIENVDPTVVCIGGLVAIAWQKLIVTNSENHGAILDKATSAYQMLMGGIVGHIVTTAGTKVDACKNMGNITANRKNVVNLVGGVVGRIAKASTVNNCKNSGAVTLAMSSTTYAGVGGIVGYPDTGEAVVVTSCENLAGAVVTCDINSTSNVGAGGILGLAGGGTYKNNTNRGAVSMKNAAASAALTCVGGIIGNDFKSATSFESNENYGSVTLVEGSKGTLLGAGGIFGVLKNNNLKSCKNYGTVTGSIAGAIVGNNAKAVSGCTVQGTVNGTTLTADNFTSYIIGTGNAATDCTF